MSEVHPNEQFIRKVYEGTATPDGIAAVIAGSTLIEETGYYHPDVVLENFDSAPVTEPYRGPKGVAAWIRDSFEIVDDGTLTLDRVAYVDDEHVVVEHTYRGKAKATGIPMEFAFASAFRIRDGQIIYAKGYLSVDDALEAARAGLDLG
jgi:ketosteroid isomerase-like protein